MKNIIIGWILFFTFYLDANTIQQKHDNKYINLTTQVEKIKKRKIKVLEYSLNGMEENKTIREKLYPYCNLLLETYGSIPDTLYISYTNENNNSKEKNLFSFSKEVDFIFLLKTISICTFFERNYQIQETILIKIKKDLDSMIVMSQNPSEAIVPYYGYIIFGSRQLKEV